MIDVARNEDPRVLRHMGVVCNGGTRPDGSRPAKRVGAL
jgi:hypothetical protein